MTWIVIRTFIAVAVFLLPALLPQTLSAREDSARLSFQKSAGPRKTRLYVVKKGEFITGIFRSQQGDEPVPYALIRQLNPEIKNLNRIYPGQRIVLPTRETTEPSAGDAEASKTPPRQYSIREGDSISRIILTELDVAPEKVLPAYRLIRRLNPDIEDMNQLPAGQLLNLPPNIVRADRPRPNQLKRRSPAGDPSRGRTPANRHACTGDAPCGAVCKGSTHHGAGAGDHPAGRQPDEGDDHRRRKLLHPPQGHRPGDARLFSDPRCRT